MFASAIPLSSSPHNLPLTYFVSDDFYAQLSVGSVVEIPIGKNLVPGIVAGFEAINTTENVKSVFVPICSTPVLADYQIRVALLLAEKYLTRIHRTLEFFLPKNLFGRMEKNAFADVIFDTAVKKGRYTNEYVYATSSQAYRNVLHEYCNDTKKNVFIFPNDAFLAEALDWGVVSVEDGLALFDSDSIVKKYKQHWQILSGEKQNVFGTRKTLFKNLSAYDRIIYIEDSLQKTHFAYTHTYKYADIFDMVAMAGNFSQTVVSMSPTVDLAYKTITKSEVFRMI